MIFEKLAFRPKLAGMVNAFERKAGVHITIHDVRGVLSLQENNRILPGRFLHNCDYCRKERFKHPVWNNRCTADCKTRIHELLRRTPEPVVKCCWKGVLEVVVPVVRQGRLMLVLYAGVFRREGAVSPETAVELPAYYHKLYHELPVLTVERQRELLALLTLLGKALLTELEEFEELSKNGTREQLILGFLRQNAHRNVSIDELAEYLNLSVSRTAHTVREQLGMTFKQALLEERMARAANLLNSNPHLSIGRISGMLGFADEHYFMRCFSKYYGMAPRRYQNMNQYELQMQEDV